MEIDLALLADAATIDASGKLNILGIFDRIGVTQFPAQHGRVTLVLRFTAGTSEIGSHEVHIRMSDPGGAEVLSLNGEIQLAGGSGARDGIRVPHILNLDGLVFTGPGMYNFDVKVDGEHHVSLPLSVEGSQGRGAAA
ncbi:MAG TPA: hypothetical protein DCG16_02815 [Gemmatimonadetes bacterium]|nr:hypothetical protein [Gemmatimonadota bacterium]|tara:strand:- start:407 stop:820 length:414 start_codon:yes stop_codon:yes gene_type:complete